MEKKSNKKITMTFNIYTSALIFNEKNEIVLVREKKEVNFNKLNFPGGHLEEWETPMNGAIRETLEETWYHIELLWLMGIFLGRNTHSFHYIFLAKICGGEVLKIPTDVLGVEFFSITEVLALPKTEFVYQEKIYHMIHKYEKNEIIPIDNIIVDLKKI